MRKRVFELKFGRQRGVYFVVLGTVCVDEGKRRRLLQQESTSELSLTGPDRCSVTAAAEVKVIIITSITAVVLVTLRIVAEGLPAARMQHKYQVYSCTAQISSTYNRFPGK